ncbi:hypothetical protein BGZ63DRAFT_406890 [Mariannaea sp. PMI_226]|nr:hypothetical protein BGZ63DRAFT_406890 [Mariannaea sp. PMI_226]
MPDLLKAFQYFLITFRREFFTTEAKFNSTQPRCLDPVKVPMNTEYFGCKAKYELNPAGKCKPSWYRSCEGYCEMYTWWDFGQEVPFDNAFCEEGPCKLKAGLQARNASFENPISLISPINLSKNSNFNFYNPNLTAIAKVRSKPKTQEEKCGYWTFVPYQVHSCGISSKGKSGRFWVASWCSNTTQQGECSTTVLQNSEKRPDGQIIFVATECGDPRKRLPFCWQEDTYLEEGVSLDAQIRKDYLLSLQDDDPLGNWNACLEGTLSRPKTGQLDSINESELV